MRRLLVAGNWKMHGSRQAVAALAQGIAEGLDSLANIDMAVFPSYVFMQQVQDLLKETTIAWGGQSLCSKASGAYTGEISGPMLVDFGCRYVLVGHSERRLIYREDNELVANKFVAAIAAGLKPVLCLGETLAQRDKGETSEVILTQLAAVLQAAGVSEFENAVIAYEPVWAIGTGVTASAQQAQEVHALIRQELGVHNKRIADNIQIIYGGSVKPDNAADLFSMVDVDGALVGGASLSAESFLAIARAAAEEQV